MTISIETYSASGKVAYGATALNILGALVAGNAVDLSTLVVPNQKSLRSAVLVAAKLAGLPLQWVGSTVTGDHQAQAQWQLNCLSYNIGTAVAAGYDADYVAKLRDRLDNLEAAYIARYV